ncbi:uncharacterized protein K489DRAFT_358959 [Dissoconium aciculare CBS 342.82]|uniref:NUC153 domain-containing protein n=1 Tax=Dissoconium aciculare CBS 342.82 TaxID=1314786 RepID=A0A6J3M038_9PEZI|nr:uncharacterized protein K489DRAFT_358959 [Dissoconium aciculare CBS 342.82]KAF1821395.1 hypothetical protein K489DRAFT_358959 [Dissoconium aciculare CBS 342.82]
MADSRFSALSSDPRYRIPNRKKSRTAIDSRFKGIFSDQDFRKKASVDRYGRKIQAEKGKKELEERFQLEEDEDEDAPELSEEDDEEDEEEAGRATTLARRDPARQGGFADATSSEEESSEEEEEESEAEIELAELTAGQEQDEEIPMGDVTKRIAAVNLDWDNIRASDIMAVSSSFVPEGGKVQRVIIYPSQFGKERLQREELEGPPKEIFSAGKKKSAEDDEEEDEEDSEDEEARIKKQLLDEQTGEGDEFDTAKLRQYQLERLRYYYAVIECDSERTAKALYDSMDGREYLSTANFFDLRFVPDETSFEDDQPHEECDSLISGYRPNEFKTEALTHSKVRLTWDDDDATRKEVQKRAFSRAEMDEEDLKAYIGSDSSDAESISSKKSSAEDRKAKKRDAQREKMRAALGLAPEPTAKSSSKKNPAEPVGDMQITFTSGLGGGKEGKSVFENEPQDEESTRARYIRKERERKQRRKEKNKAGGKPDDGEADDAEVAENDDEEAEEADPFDDPFFNDPSAASKAEASAKKAEKQRKRAALAATDAETQQRAAELDLLMASEQADNLRHFDMREIKKAEKDAKRSKNKKFKNKSAAAAEAAVADEFQVETDDPRFKKLFESHEFAIDPTDRLFAGTKAMKATVEEGRKKRRRVGGKGDEAPEEPEEEERRERKQGKKARRARV